MADNSYLPSYDAATEALKVPPHSIEAEQSVLGALLLNNDSWDDVADMLTDHDFYHKRHRIIFRGISALFEKSQPVDVVTLTEWHQRQDELNEVGDFAYIGMLARDTPSAANITAYAKIVREHSILRQLIATATKIGDGAFNSDGRSSTDILDMAEQQILAIAEKGAKQGRPFKQIKDTLPKLTEHLDILREQKGTLTGLATGFMDFDQKTLGLQRGDLIIVAGRPSMGKTAFAMNIVEHAACTPNDNNKKSVAVFSMEMPADALVLRIISSQGEINHSHLRSGNLDGDKWTQFTAITGQLNQALIFVDDTPALTVTELRARARRLKRQHGLDLIVIDYIQLMQANGDVSNSENRATQLSEISRGLKALARELDIPVLALSQLNRSLEQRPNKRPIMSDLRESGAIEQDADVITFIYRDEVYNDHPDNKGTAEIIISKQRNGPIGTIKLTFEAQYTRFKNFAHGTQADYFNGQ